MPGFDGTGPWGQGPMTGGARGYCRAGAGYGRGFRGYGRGYGMGGGRGFRRGFGAGYGFSPRGGFPVWGAGYGPYASRPYDMGREEEIRMLEGEAAMVKDRLEDINRRLRELEEQKTGE